MTSVERVCIVVKETPLQGLVKRYGTKGQARFVLEQRAVAFEAYERYDHVYQGIIEKVKAGLPSTARISVVDFQYLPTYQFDPHCVVVTVGPDGLVANTAKYLDGQPIVAVNPDPQTIDGVLARNAPCQASFLLRNPDRAVEKRLTMAEAVLGDAQTLLAVNDLFIGQRTHVSARYEIEYNGQREAQSSSGVIVSTGAGSTGWRRSIVTGAFRVAGMEVEVGPEDYAFPPDDRRLAFAVREPFVSRSSWAGVVAGTIEEGQELVVTSQMPQNGVIFSDGVESDFLEFNGGESARIRVAKKTGVLWTPIG